VPVSEPVAIGIDVGGTKLVAATVSAEGSVVERHRRETPAHDAALLVSTVRDLIATLGTSLPVGLGIAGLVTPAGAVRYGPNIKIRDLDLRHALEDATSGTVCILNDASAAALGEQRAGAGRASRDVVLFTLGTGVGGGLVVDGQLVVGASGFAGELGHLVVAEGGRACPCGNRGCIEAYASGNAIGLLARERLVDLSLETSLRVSPELDGRAVSRAANDGDRFAQGLLEEVGHWLGIAAASMVNALDPDLVLIGGGAAPPSAPFLLPAARRSMADHLLGSRWRIPPPIELTALGDDAGMVGAALYAAERHQDRRRATT
jgi:glucokinase